MTGPDLSAACFTGEHAGCKFPRCQCPCHRPDPADEMFAEPGPYPTVPAIEGEETGVNDPHNSECRDCHKTCFVPPHLYFRRTRPKCWSCGGLLEAMEEARLAELHDAKNLRAKVSQRKSLNQAHARGPRPGNPETR